MFIVGNLGKHQKHQKEEHETQQLHRLVVNTINIWCVLVFLCECKDVLLPNFLGHITPLKLTLDLPISPSCPICSSARGLSGAGPRPILTTILGWGLLSPFIDEEDASQRGEELRSHSLISRGFDSSVWIQSLCLQPE